MWVGKIFLNRKEQVVYDGLLQEMHVNKRESISDPLDNTIF